MVVGHGSWAGWQAGRQAGWVGVMGKGGVGQAEGCWEWAGRRRGRACGEGMGQAGVVGEASGGRGKVGAGMTEARWGRLWGGHGGKVKAARRMQQKITGKVCVCGGGTTYATEWSRTRVAVAVKGVVSALYIQKNRRSVARGKAAGKPVANAARCRRRCCNGSSTRPGSVPMRQQKVTGGARCVCVASTGARAMRWKRRRGRRGGGSVCGWRSATAAARGSSV